MVMPWILKFTVRFKRSLFILLSTVHSIKFTSCCFIISVVTLSVSISDLTGLWGLLNLACCRTALCVLLKKIQKAGYENLLKCWSEHIYSFLIVILFCKDFFTVLHNYMNGLIFFWKENFVVCRLFSWNLWSCQVLCILSPCY